MQEKPHMITLNNLVTTDKALIIQSLERGQYGDA